MFKHDLLNIPTISSEDTPNGRYYTTPNGDKYQSVTTFLSKFSDDSWLVEWVARVGEDQAKRTSTQAKGRGTSVHSILEQYVLNNKFYSKGAMPNNLIMAGSIIKHLEKKLSVVRGIEIGLWSDDLKIAGRADLFGTYSEQNSIIDFKTSKYKKSEEDIQSYFLQCTIYAMMIEELFEIDVPQIVVLIGVDHEDAQEFVRLKDEFVPKIHEMMKQI